jgi:predicted MPP superfamily phosphohydrolase
MPPAQRALTRTLTMGALAGLSGVAYAAGYEARAYTLRHVEMPVLAAGRRAMKVLHLSDIHLTPGQRKKQRWLRNLCRLEPDLVVNTGDNLAHRDSVPFLLDALGDLLDIPGVFVMGSNDYFAPTARNPARYLLPDDGRRNTDTFGLPWRDLRDGFERRGWLDLSNRRGTLDVDGLRVAFAGVDDPHLGYDDLRAVAGQADPAAGLRVAVAHAPYRRVLDAFARDGYDAIFAGHTHGGQLRLPMMGAIVTNCDLEPARARGLHRHPAGSGEAQEGSWLHVSAGLGTSPYTPVRFACRPEASLLTLTSR